jgi:hypothetical protein
MNYKVAALDEIYNCCKLLSQSEFVRMTYDFFKNICC